MKSTGTIAVRAALVVLAVLIIAAASDTERWIQGSRVEFLKGDPKSASISSVGSIMLPPVADKLYPGDEQAAIQPFIWSLAVDGAGKIYAAGGSEGIIYDNNGIPLHDAEEPEIYAMAVGPDNRIYFGTSPNGAVYRLNAAGGAEKFFTPTRSLPPGAEAQNLPPERYIWDLAFDTDGNLYVATGIEGRVYKVTPDGSGTVAFDSDEANITSITVDSRGRVLFGSDPGGQIFQLDQAGNVFVLFDAPMKEINNIAVTTDGLIYATGVAEGALKPNEKVGGNNGEPEPLLTRTGSVAVATATNGSSSNGEKSALYRILQDGSVEKIWASSDNVAYSLAIDVNGNAVFGTGPKGMLVSVNGEGVETVLRSLEGSQVTALVANRGTLYAGVSNLGAVYRIANRYAVNGEFISQVKDTGTVSSFGAVRWNAEGSNVTIHTRTGNTAEPDNTWSKWSTAYTDPQNSKVSSPAARFVQWRAVLSTSEPASSPSLQSVSIYYMQRNVRPRVRSLSVLPTGVTFKENIDDPDAQEIPAEIVKELREHNINAGNFSGSGKAIFRRHMRTFRWRAEDVNDDQLRYSVLVRPIQAQDWLRLAEGIEENFFSFDSRGLSDGTYVVRIEATDSASNTRERALAGHLDSQPFDVDNAPPAVEGLAATASGSTATISFEAVDNYSTIKSIRLRVDDGAWMIVLPEDGIPDSRRERVQVQIPDVAAGDHHITVQVQDELFNVGAAGTKVTIR